MILRRSVRRLTRMGLLFGLLAGTSGANHCTPAPPWPLGHYDGRSWQRIVVPGAQCGAGGEFAVFYSPASRPEGATRLVVYFQGGGMTFAHADGSLYTLAGGLAGLKLLTHAPAAVDLSTNVFMDRHPENDAFIGAAHWVFYPYCTQDFHAGRKSVPTAYDLMSTAFETEIETLLGQGTSVAELEATYPGLDVLSVVGGTDVTAATFSIIHRGYLNFLDSLAPISAAIEAATPGADLTDYVVSGGSAGSLGAFLLFQLFGDLAYAFGPGDRLTLAPMGFSPFTRRYDPGADALVPVPALVDFFADAYASWDLVEPCDIAGGTHTPAGSDACTDLLDLVDHYRARWPGVDIRYAPVFDKEDSVIRGALHWADFAADPVLDFCRTSHRYGQRLAERTNVAPWTIWQATHVPGQAYLLTEMVSPSGAGTPSSYNLLGFFNELATRAFPGAPVHVEHVFNRVVAPTNPDSTVTPDPTHLPECDVPAP